MRPPFARRTILLLILGVVLVGALWVGWLAWRVNTDLNASVSDVERLQTALEAGDDAGVDEALEDLQDHSASAADRTDGLTWSLLTHLPHYGDDADGVRLVLVHTFDEPNEAPEYGAGWHLCLSALTARLDGRDVPPVAGEAAREHGWEDLRAKYAEILSTAASA